MGEPLAPLLRVEDGEDVLVGHEALLHVPDLQVVQWQHVLLLLLLGGEGGHFVSANEALSAR